MWRQTAQSRPKAGGGGGIVVPDGLVSYWTCNDAANGTCIDSVSGNNGTLYQSPAPTNGVAGVAGTAYLISTHVNGGRFITVSNEAAFNLSTFTISLWWKKTEANSYEGPFNNEVAAQSGFQLVNWNGGDPYRPELVVTSGSSEVGHYSVTNTYFAPQPWQHQVWTWDGTNACCYIDDLQKTVSNTGDSGYQHSGVIIGRTYGIIDGCMAYIRVYNRAITYAEETLIHNSEKAP